MNQLPRFAVMTELVKQLDAHQSWCGETHIQKAAFFLQELLRVPTDFEFILYKHGPFSFSLRDELAAMRTYQLLELVPQPLPYGPSWRSTDNAIRMRENYSVTLNKYRPQIEFVATVLGPKRVGDLEKLATALYLVRQYPRESDEQLSVKMNELKPHVTVEEAREALCAFRSIEHDATALVVPNVEA